MSTDDIAALNAALLQQVADLHALIGWLDVGHQQMKDVMAAEVHEQLGSPLTALAMRLALITRHAGSEPKLAEHWAKANTLIGNLTQTTRRLQHQLRPVALDALNALGLSAALAEYLEQFGQRTGIACTLTIEGSEVPLSLATNQALFRILSGAVDNIGQHAGARSMQVLLGYDAMTCHMTVSDDGCGIDLSRLDWQRSYGLRLMRERATILKATFEIISLPGQGCRVTLRLPLPLPLPQ